jgi:hypothetical protein
MDDEAFSRVLVQDQQLAPSLLLLAFIDESGAGIGKNLHLAYWLH